MKIQTNLELALQALARPEGPDVKKAEVHIAMALVALAEVHEQFDKLEQQIDGLLQKSAAITEHIVSSSPKK